MNSIPSTEFQSNYQRLDEPVTVMARSRTLGTWYPKGTEPDEIKDALPQSDAYLNEMVAEIARLKKAAEADSLEIIRLQHEWANANGDAMREAGENDAEIAYLKKQLAARLTTKVPPVEQILTNVHAPSVAVRAGSFGHSSPAPKGGTK